ncbi:claudin-8-like [Synchiropus splendidus]|uniref:claudin-8-like n=1 Tax=Synchiropus splendidus TaxID=270530 RepID=UPI00237E3DD5|nr:claudin-8-like [Synchiropus splendidus]
MIQGVSEIAALLVGVVGLIGAAAATGMPMWKVTAFIEENIIVMETRWEGLWMNCYRQANIRMQCKVYDSLLFLPSELQAARGLMCCSLALSGIGLIVGLTGLRCVSCFRGNRWAKTLMLMVAGVMQFLACICVFIPVSWTGHVIIRDFYNPLLIDAQRRELGEALYIGWVAGAFLFCSALLFVCRRRPKEKGSFEVYHPPNLLSYKAIPSRQAFVNYRPVSTLSSLQSTMARPPPLSNTPVGPPIPSVPQLLANNGAVISPPVVYNPESASLLYQASLAHQASLRSNPVGSLYTPANSLYLSQNTAPYSPTYIPSTSYQSSFHPVQQNPVFIGYKQSTVEPESFSVSSAGVYI